MGKNKINVHNVQKGYLEFNTWDDDPEGMGYIHTEEFKIPNFEKDIIDIVERWFIYIYIDNNYEPTGRKTGYRTKADALKDLEFWLEEEGF